MNTVLNSFMIGIKKRRLVIIGCMPDGETKRSDTILFQFPRVTPALVTC